MSPEIPTLSRGVRNNMVRERFSVGVDQIISSKRFLRKTLVQFAFFLSAHLTGGFGFIGDDTTDEMRCRAAQSRHQIVQLLLRFCFVRFNDVFFRVFRSLRIPERAG